MKHASLSAAGALVLLANAFALAHAARNRSGPPEAELLLTERELIYYADPDDSGVALTLRWVDWGAPRYSSVVKPDELQARNWLNGAKLAELGFDTHVDPSSRDSYRFYNRQGARTAFVALEYDGPAWQSWIELEDRIQKAETETAGPAARPPAVDPQYTRLVVIDAARGPALLRARYPDRARILIAPAIIRISLSSYFRPAQPVVLTGYIQEIPSVIHVPRPDSDAFRADPRPTRYQVRLRYGRFFEPSIVGVDFTR
jgi:hypothetical protein